MNSNPNFVFQTLARVAELRANGLWASDFTTPKAEEPTFSKTHWNYVMDEAVWMYEEYEKEKKWKKRAAKAVIHIVAKYHRDVRERRSKIEREENQKMRKIASTVAKEVMQFWSNVEKIVMFKREGYVNARKKQILDEQLDQMVEQTEKYSHMLQEGMKNNETNAEDEDGFSETEGSDDRLGDNTGAVGQSDENSRLVEKTKVEIDALKKESELPIDELLSTVLPKDVLESLRKGSFLPQADYSENEGAQSSDEDLSEESESDEEGVSVGESSETHDDIMTETDGDTKTETSINGRDVDRTLVPYGGNTFRSSELGIFAKLEKENTSAAEEVVSDDSSIEVLPTSNIKTKTSVKQQQQDVIKEDQKLDVEKSEAADSNCNGDAKEHQGDYDDATNSGMTSALDGFTQMAEQLQPKGYTYQSADVKVEVPFLLKNTKLREYQHIGLQWLVTMYEKKLNGILADEMGLGKTIQTIALLAYLACNEENWGPHLVVVPTSVMLNWEIEFKKWCPGFKVLTYYGSIKERKMKRRGWMAINAFNICITSYKLVIQDAKCFKSKRWKYLILDEAQNIKNFKSQRWQVLLNFPCDCRLLLTGTPLQNSLMELWSLLHFLMPNVFENHRDFKEWFSNPLTGMIEGSQEYNEKLVARLHKVLRPFLLRRIKDEVEKQMPKKYEHVIKCRLSKRQRFLYDDFMARGTTKDTLASGHFMSVINVLMQLRKVCNHPDMFEPRPIVTPLYSEPLNIVMPSKVVDLCHNASPLSYVDIVETTLVSKGPTAYEAVAPCCMETVLQVDNWEDEEIRFQTQLKENFISQTLSSFSFSQIMSFKPDLKNLINGQNSAVTKKIRLPSGKDVEKIIPLTDDVSVQSFRFKKYKTNLSNCRKQTLKSLASISYRKCLPLPNIINHQFINFLHKSKLKPLRRREFSFSGLQAIQMVSENRRCKNNSRHLFFHCSSTLMDLIPDIFVVAEKLAPVLETFLMYVPRVVSNSPSLYAYHLQRLRTAPEDLMKLSLNRILRNSTYLQLTHSRMQALFPETRLIQYDCGKLQTLDLLLKRLKSDAHRVLIFTQMTRMLDILETFLNYHGHRYLRLDGSTKIEQRQYLMERFNTDPKIFVFILSTRSGGIGVNLTGADTVIFYDSDWNPTVDSQAQDRCHRIGQTRDVHIYRLISDRTVEENIFKKATQKRLLGDLAIEHGNFNAAFFQSNSIKELFDIETEENNEKTVVEENDTIKTSSTQTSTVKKCSESVLKKAEAKFQQVLSKVEDAQDVDACKLLEKEQVAELDEFNENEEDTTGELCAEIFANVDREMAEITEKLSSVERYAFSYVENCLEPLTRESIEQAVQAALFAQRNQVEHLKSNKLSAPNNSHNSQDSPNVSAKKNTKPKMKPVFANSMRSSSRIALNKEREEYQRTTRDYSEFFETDSDSSRPRKRPKTSRDASCPNAMPSHIARSKRAANRAAMPLESTPKKLVSPSRDKSNDKSCTGRKPRVVLHVSKKGSTFGHDDLSEDNTSTRGEASEYEALRLKGRKRSSHRLQEEVLNSSSERKYPARKRTRVKYEDYLNEFSDTEHERKSRKTYPRYPRSIKDNVETEGTEWISPSPTSRQQPVLISIPSSGEVSPDICEDGDSDSATELTSGTSTTVPYSLSDTLSQSSSVVVSGGLNGMRKYTSSTTSSVTLSPLYPSMQPLPLVHSTSNRTITTSSTSSVNFRSQLHVPINEIGASASSSSTVKTPSNVKVIRFRSSSDSAQTSATIPSIRVQSNNLSGAAVPISSNGSTNIFQLLTSNGAGVDSLSPPGKSPTYRTCYPPVSVTFPQQSITSLNVLPQTGIEMRRRPQVLNYSTFSHHPSLVSFPPRAPHLVNSATGLGSFSHSRQTYVIKQNTSVPVLRIPSAVAGPAAGIAGTSNSGSIGFIRGIGRGGFLSSTSSCLPPTLIRQPSAQPPPNIVKTPRYPLG